MTFRKVSGAATANCNAGETLLSAYCIGTGTLSITEGEVAACAGDGARTVAICAK
jgi:hypothetical protein